MKLCFDKLSTNGYEGACFDKLSANGKIKKVCLPFADPCCSVHPERVEGF
jgi:hypothetical protein